MSDAGVRSLVDDLQARYVAAIDDDGLEGWPAFFTDPCRYEITTAENYDAGRPLGLYFADTRAALIDRVQSLRRANIYEAQRYRHLVSATVILEATPSFVRAQSNFLVVRTMLDGEMRIFAAGRYVDRIDITSGSARFAEKLAILDNRRIDTLLALPI